MEMGKLGDTKLEIIIRNLEERNFNLALRYNNSEITFIGFIISVSGVLLGLKENLSTFAERAFFTSIILLTMGIYLFLEETKIGIKRQKKLYEIARGKSNGENKTKEVSENNEKTCTEKIIGKLHPALQTIGLVIFLLGIISFMFPSIKQN